MDVKRRGTLAGVDGISLNSGCSVGPGAVAAPQGASPTWGADGARRSLENGKEDPREAPPAFRLTAPGKDELLIRVFIGSTAPEFPDSAWPVPEPPNYPLHRSGGDTGPTDGDAGRSARTIHQPTVLPARPS